MRERFCIGWVLQNPQEILVIRQPPIKLLDAVAKAAARESDLLFMIPEQDLERADRLETFEECPQSFLDLPVRSDFDPRFPAAFVSNRNHRHDLSL